MNKNLQELYEEAAALCDRMKAELDSWDKVQQGWADVEREISNAHRPCRTIRMFSA